MAEKLCWDCPQRSGVSRTAGKLMEFYLGFKKDGSDIIKKQRGECIGRVPVKVLTQFGVKDDVGEEVVTTTNEGHTLYVAGCPKGMEEIPQVSDDVRIGFGFNGKTHFVETLHEVNTIPRSEYDAMQANLRESHRAIVESMTVD